MDAIAAPAARHFRKWRRFMEGLFERISHDLNRTDVVPLERPADARAQQPWVRRTFLLPITVGSLLEPKEV